MDHSLIYNQIINRARSRSIEGYTEKHHIVPKCLGGSNDKSNIVRLTGREHYIVHQLLVKIYPNNRGLIYALHAMSVFKNASDGMLVGRSKNKRYSWVREKHAKQVSLDRKGKTGYKQTEEHRNKCTQSRIGIKRSDETRQRMSNAKKGKVFSEEHKTNISISMKARNQSTSEEFIKEKTQRYKKVSQALKGIKRSEETRKKMSEARKRTILRKSQNNMNENLT